MVFQFHKWRLLNSKAAWRYASRRSPRHHRFASHSFTWQNWRMSAGIVIERMAGEAEARVCARMMAESEPWITLRRGFDAALRLTSDPAKEVYVARVGGELAGHIVVNMEGPFAGYIQALVVAPEWRGRRIGEQLARFAEERIFR